MFEKSTATKGGVFIIFIFLPTSLVTQPDPAHIIPNGSDVEKHSNIKIILFNKLFFHKFF